MGKRGRIMEKGIKRIGKIKEVVTCYCTHCKTVYEVDKNAIGHITYTDYGGGTESIHGFRCPEPNCGTIVEIKNKLPKGSIVE